MSTLLQGPEVMIAGNPLALLTGRALRGCFRWVVGKLLVAGWADHYRLFGVFCGGVRVTREARAGRRYLLHGRLRTRLSRTERTKGFECRMIRPSQLRTEKSVNHVLNAAAESSQQVRGRIVHELELYGREPVIMIGRGRALV